MQLFLGPVELEISNCSLISFKLLPSLHYTSPIISPQIKFYCNYSVTTQPPDLSKFTNFFTGQSHNIEEMPYNWHVASNDNCFALKIDYINNEDIKEIYSSIDFNAKTINCYFITHNNKSIEIDPLVQPLGSLLLIYLANITNGFLIHASGVYIAGKGYIFTAVSGTGKSTMAGLWKQAGADIINDDRLWLHKMDDKWFMFNTPMVWYAQPPKLAPVDKIFLIRQSKTNEIKQLKGLATYMKVMSNCIQHFYNKEMTSKHIERVIDFTSNTPIYDCGFKPDGEIVGMVVEV